jgi:hypothetical protein
MRNFYLQGNPMIEQSDELLHIPGLSSDWEEHFRVNFIDKKARTYGAFDISIRPHSRECDCSWLFFIDGVPYSIQETCAFESKEGGRTAGGKSLKFKITIKNTFEATLKGSHLEAKLTITPLFHAYDFPFAPGRSADQKREEFESQLWKRYDQRCRVSGEVVIKNGPRKKFDSFGEREHIWGNMLWKNLSVSSRFFIQFKEMSVSLSCLNFGGALVSNGFFSRRSGNIPVIGIELEHLDFDKTKKFKSSEISYLDSQDDRDLIVSNALFAPEREEIKAGKRKFIRSRSFSEFSIIGANKKGIGYEEHLIIPEMIPLLTGER